MFALKLQKKIIGLLVLYFVGTLLAVGSTLYVSWRLEGNDAAINNAAKERMRLYHIAFLLALQVGQSSPRQPQDVTDLRFDIEDKITQFETVLNNLMQNAPPHSLSIFRDNEVRDRMSELHRHWYAGIKPDIRRILDTPQRTEQEKMLVDIQPALGEFVDHVDDLVGMAERNDAHVATLLHYFQIGLASLALIGTVLLSFLFSLIVVRPITRLREGIQRMGKADFKVRLPITGRDEFGELAEGFNQMAAQLQEIYATLEQRIEEKTHSIEIKNRELMALYDVAVFLNSSTATEPLCGIVLDKLCALVGAHDGVVRLVDHTGKQMKIVATHGVSKSFLAEEHCLAVGACLCGDVTHDGVVVNSDFSIPTTPALLYACKRDGFQAVVAVPIRSKQRVKGMLNLFFKEPRILPPSEIRLLESVGQQLGIAIENQRLVAREKEMAVSEERNLLAQELHDSIAQSLAYLNIQVQLLHEDLQQGRTAEALQALEQIREGVQESYDNVRELLVHFRIRIDSADLETALRSALEKFEGQTGIAVTFSRQGTVPGLPPEHVLQVMHIVQESLSNIRKHANASRVDAELVSNTECVLCIRDNGAGLDTARAADDAHVGLSIMRERAHRIGAELALESVLGRGMLVRLVLPHRSVYQA
jgi:two-component system nitrate/nitrite sensor histidine kinase NarX